MFCAAPAFSDTSVFIVGDKLNAVLSAKADDPKILYKLLNFEEMEGRSGIAKFFKTGDGVVEINCT
jgi:hypothetical protein